MHSFANPILSWPVRSTTARFYSEIGLGRQADVVEPVVSGGPPGVEAVEPAVVEAVVEEAAPGTAPVVVEAGPTPEELAQIQQDAAAAVFAASVAPPAAMVDPYAHAQGAPSGGLSHKMDIASAMIGKLIGKGGETIKSLQFNTGARIQVRPPPNSIGRIKDRCTSRLVSSRAAASQPVISNAVVTLPSYRAIGPAGVVSPFQCFHLEAFTLS